MVASRLALGSALLGALVLVPAATAAFPAPFAVQGGDGVATLRGSVQVVAYSAGAGRTRLDAIRTGTGRIVRSRTIPGSFGIPALTQTGLAGGVSHDGRMLVLQGMGLHATSRFALVRVRDLAPRATILLRGTFGFDALSPDGRMLYLIQHTSVRDIEHYIVRAYDLRLRRLLPGRVADRTQESWVMQGWAVDRATTVDGRWAYTLYANPGGYPFVHALDTVRGVAHCVGLPWMSTDQAPVWDFRLAVSGGELLVREKGGAVWRRIDRTTWRVTSQA
jgi:hypothetical protein